MPSTSFLDNFLRRREMKVGKNRQIVSKTMTLELSHLPGDWIRLFRRKIRADPPIHRRKACLRSESLIGIRHPNGFHHQNLTRSSI
jgi:hypothetical protein